MDFKIKLFESLKSIYGNKVYDVDNDTTKLKKLGWFLIKDSKRPDFLIFEDNGCVLVELKEIVEKEEDIKIKNELAKKRPVSYWVPDMKRQLKRIIDTANRQFKEFIRNHHAKLDLKRRNIKTILAVHCDRFMLHKTIANFEEILYGGVLQTRHQNENITFSVDKKLLNAEKYTSTALLAIWNNKNGFSTYNNTYYRFQNIKPFFLTKKDTNYFIYDDLFSVYSGVRIRIYDEIKFEQTSNRILKINNKLADSDSFMKVIRSEIEEVKELINKQRDVLRY